MGITQFSLDYLDKYIKEGSTVLELGAQNLYGEVRYGKYASEWYLNEKKVSKYVTIDMNGENEALKINLGEPFDLKEQFDVITDYGTSEHVGKKAPDLDWYYNCWKGKHDHCKVGGHIISENPKQGNWPQHGLNYITQDFYVKLAQLMGYEILEMGDHPAMHNTIDGYNVWCVLRKVEDKAFINKRQFSQLDIKGE